MEMFFLAWDLSQMPPGQSFEMTQEKPVSLILKLRRANNFVINVIVYSEYDSEIEMMNNRKVICHEFEIQIEYVDLVMVQHVPNSRKRKCMIKHTLNTFTV